MCSYRTAAEQHPVSAWQDGLPASQRPLSCLNRGCPRLQASGFPVPAHPDNLRLNYERRYCFLKNSRLIQPHFLQLEFQEYCFPVLWLDWNCFVQLMCSLGLHLLLVYLQTLILRQADTIHSAQSAVHQ